MGKYQEQTSKKLWFQISGLYSQKIYYSWGGNSLFVYVLWKNKQRPIFNNHIFKFHFCCQILSEEKLWKISPSLTLLSWIQEFCFAVLPRVLRLPVWLWSHISEAGHTVGWGKTSAKPRNKGEQNRPFSNEARLRQEHRWTQNKAITKSCCAVWWAHFHSDATVDRLILSWHMGISCKKKKISLNVSDILWCVALEWKAWSNKI